MKIIENVDPFRSWWQAHWKSKQTLEKIYLLPKPVLLPHRVQIRNVFSINFQRIWITSVKVNALIPIMEMHVVNSIFLLWTNLKQALPNKIKTIAEENRGSGLIPGFLWMSSPLQCEHFLTVQTESSPQCPIVTESEIRSFPCLIQLYGSRFGPGFKQERSRDLTPHRRHHARRCNCNKVEAGSAVI